MVGCFRLFPFGWFMLCSWDHSLPATLAHWCHQAVMIFALLHLTALQHYGCALPQGTGGGWKKIERHKIQTGRNNHRRTSSGSAGKAKARESHSQRCCENRVNLLLGEICV